MANEHPNDSITIILDGNPVTTANRKLNGVQIRELGPADRVQGFETQEVDNQGRKIKTIRDDETVEIHPDERFRTVPNQGGPGSC